MSISTEIVAHFQKQGVVDTVIVNKKSELHGEEAIDVLVNLYDGRWVAGSFTSHPRQGFGGVEFAGPKDIPALMIAKVESVLKGTAE